MKRLIVLVTGLDGAPQKWQPLLTRLRQEEELINSDWLFFDHYGFWNLRAFSKQFTKSMATLSLDLKAKIEQYYLAAMMKGEPYDDIICIGHSFGGLLVRQAYLLAAGAYAHTPPSEIKWPDQVSRFLLLASTNRGFTPHNAWVLAAVNLSAATGLLPFLHETIAGSAFVTNLRISWIRYMTSLNGHEPVMIQLLGTQDGIVKRSDSIDLQQFPHGVQLDVPNAHHDDLYRPQGGKTASEQEDWELRYTLLKWAILQCDPQRPEPMPRLLQGKITADLAEPATTTATVFLIHGIRDSNSGWADELEVKIRQQTDPPVAVVRSTYGYFSAFNFFFPWLRRQNIRWFQDQYSYQFALNPQAEFYFIGHSNGTYILGESLKRVPAMTFKRIYLAGSVLPCDYPWPDRFDLGQVELLRNDRSSLDWPVGILCSGLRGLGMKDIGTGGFDGFHFDDDRTEEVYYYAGGHGEPLAPANQNSILAFILRGDRDRPDHLLTVNQLSSRFKWISRAAPYVAPFLLLIVLGIALLGGWWIFRDFAWQNVGFWLKLIVSATILYVVYALAKTG